MGDRQRREAPIAGITRAECLLPVQSNKREGACAFPYASSMRDPSAGGMTLLRRGFRRRCARCGGRELFPKFLSMVEHCPSCGYRFERDHGYWIGAMIISTAFTLVGFLVVFVGGMLIWWPDVPWTGLLIASLSVTAILPVLGYPTARTVWVALDLMVRPLEAAEINRAAQSLNGTP